MKKVLLLVCICLMLCLTACNGETNDISQFAEQPEQGGQRQTFTNMENSVRGKVLSIDDSKIVIDLAEQPQTPQGGGQNPPQGGEQPQGERQVVRERRQPGEGENQPGEGGGQRIMPEMKLTGEKGEYIVTADTEVTSARIQQGQEEHTYSMADVTVGSNVVLQLDDAKTTVLSIRLMRGPN